MTFSIVAADPTTGDCGVAVQSKFLAVGALVPWARADAGAVATQALADVTIGPRALDLLATGLAPDAIVEQIVEADPLREQRQFGIVASDGRAASFTGSECFDHASSTVGEGYAAQGNILAGRAVVDGLVAGFLLDPLLPLAERLLSALRGAQAGGGDRRGMESAALVVVRRGGGYGGNHDRYIDLRVDDHPAPIDELGRLLALHRLYFERPAAAEILEIDSPRRVEIDLIIARRGHTPPGTPFADALFALFGWENLEERWIDADHIDAIALDYLHTIAGG
jgi:uncharacterized Ntn-hydrolase superfamily protein